MLPFRCIRAHLSGLLAATLLLTIAGADAGSVPSDFRIRARFFPGAGNVDGPRPWRLTVGADGTATYETHTYSPHRTHLKKTRLSPEQLLTTYTTIERAAFFQLPREIYTPHAGSELGHQMGIELRVTAHGRTREVVFDVPGTLRDRGAAKRFWSIWRVMSDAVPSPNRNDEFTYWFHYNPL